MYTGMLCPYVHLHPNICILYVHSRTKFDLLSNMQVVDAEKNRSTCNIKVLGKKCLQNMVSAFIPAQIFIFKNMKPWYKIF
jgi:hypothetical protein